MADGFIVRKGGAVTEQALAPTITEVSVTTDSITFTIKNEDTQTAIIRYRIDDINEEGEIIELAGGATSAEIEITGLDDDTTYTVFATANVTGKIKSEVAALNITTNEIIPELAVQWVQSTDTVTRIGDADGLSRSDFDTLEPWASMRRCMVNDNLSINYYIDPDDPDDIGEVINTGSYTTGDPADYTGGDGQVMVEIPKFFYKTDSPSSNVYQWYISMEQKSGYDVHPAFVTDGVTRDKIYMSAFEGSAATSTSTLRSISGVQPLSNRTITEFRSQAQSRGTGWQIQTYLTTQALQVLYLVEYADFDSQTTIGRGVVDMQGGTGNESQDTGRTIPLGNASGKIEVTSLDRGNFASQFSKVEHISYRGIENFFGNIDKFVDGLNGSPNAYVANEDFEINKTTSPYTFVGSVASQNGFITNIRFPFFLATSVGGSSTSHLHDGYFIDSGNKVGVLGGNWSRGLSAGFFYMPMSTNSDASAFSLNSRLQIL
jgi:hypothetical protein